MCTQCGLCSGDGYCEVLSSLTVFCPNTLLGYIYQHACVCTFELDVCVTGSLEMEVRGQLVGLLSFSHHVGPVVQTQVLRFGDRHCYCLTNLASPQGFRAGIGQTTSCAVF